MVRIVEIFGQAGLDLDRGDTSAIGFMDGVDRAATRPTLKERLGFNLKGLGCCGVSTAAMSEEGPELEPVSAGEPGTQAVAGMNLAAALAAERELRAAAELDPGTPARVSLMRLLEETEAWDVEGNGGGGSGWVCCVCMGREKGAAFIPCGHTFCRVCSRELWVNRGSCPLCNRPILEILDIF